MGLECAVAGHYRYEQLAVKLPDGCVRLLKDLGLVRLFLHKSRA